MTFFTPDEFKCKCGCGMDVVDDVKVMATSARSYSGVPYFITSGARCLAHNRSIGSKDTSSHVKGLAFDVRFRNNHEKFLILYGLIRAGFKRIGLNEKAKFFHVDIDKDKPQKTMFGY